MPARSPTVCSRTAAALSALLLAATILAPAVPLAAQQHAHAELDHHFAHPMVTEGVLPETGFRLDYTARPGSPSQQTTIGLGAGYAFSPSLGIEVGVPLHLAGAFAGGWTVGTPHLGLHFASFALERQGVLLGYGVELGSAGGHHGGAEEDHAVLEPFVNLGTRHLGVEVIASSRLALPVRAEGEGHRSLAFGLSALRPLSPRLEGLLEVQGEFAVGGQDAERELRFTPGLKLAPFAAVPHLRVGAGMSVPVAGTGDAHPGAVVSLFYHP